MSMHFSASQFDDAFIPHKLRNWEVPRWHIKTARPRKVPTKAIADDRGRFLPSAERIKHGTRNYFKDTWALPRKLTKKVVEEYNNKLSGKIREQFSKRSHKARESQDSREANKPSSVNSRKTDHEYIPGDLTKPHDQHESRTVLIEQDNQKQNESEPNELFLEKHQCNDTVALLNEDESKIRDSVPHVLGEDVEDNFEKMRLGGDIPDKPNQRSPSPLIPAFYNFQLARRMHQENLEHQPLPDCVMDQAYRRLQAQSLLDPGLALDVRPTASGVGIKTYKAGPTHCTKLKIYRPKTCGVVPKPLTDLNMHRPSTSGPAKVKMGQMDLAICWDYRPRNPLDEPKRTKHIDGSNGSAAPAIFTLVKTPRTPENPDTGRSGGIFNCTLGDEGFFDKDILRRKTGMVQKSKSDLKCTCGTSPIDFENLRRSASRSQSTSRQNSGFIEKRKRCKSSPNLSQIAVAGSETQFTTEAPSRHRQHTCSKYGPQSKEHKTGTNQKKKIPRMCQKVGPQPYPEIVEKQEYKMAFKAGIPKSNSSGTVTSFDSGCSTMSSNTCSTKVLHIPKPRAPYAKKNYNIDTLAPPFACYKGGAGQGGYPEHWRLASVYQHAYKPIEQRRRPLLETVYK